MAVPDHQNRITAEPAIDPSSPPVLFILAYLHAWVCAPVRILEPQRWLNTIPGVRAVAVEPGEGLDLDCPEEKRVFIWQRAVLFNRLEFLALQKELVRRGYLIVAEFDDDPEFFSALRMQGFITFTTCHCVQTTTAPLAKELRAYHPHVQEFANHLGELPPPRSYPEGGPVTVFFGAQNRQGDAQQLVPAVNRILAKYPGKIRMRVIWDRGFFDALQTPDKEFTSFHPYDEYKKVLGSCDIALLPLSPTKFNSLKSDIKFVECAGHGATVLASPTVYADALRDGETGLLFRSLGEFEAQLTRLIENRPLRIRLAENAYKYVAQSRLVSQHIRERYQWYLRMYDQLPQLNAELRERMPELFEP
jgi:glycosyltransferase involved in cell wall biosynthesis